MGLVRKLSDWGVLTWMLGLTIWQILSIVSGPKFLPGPAQTLMGALELAKDGSLWAYIAVSLQRVLSGWILGSLLGMPIGLIMGRVTAVRSLTDPFLNFIRFVPPLAFVTLFMLWLGIGEESKVALIVYATVFTVILNTMTGALSVEEDKIRAARCMGASEWQILVHVIIPATVPHMFTGVRLSMSTSYMAIVGAEMIAADKGVGFMIWNARLYFKTDWIFVGLFTLGIMGFCTDRALLWLGSVALSRYGVVDSAVFRGKSR